MIKVVYLGINVSDCQLAECLRANASGKWLPVMCEVAYWYNNSLPSLRLPLPPFHLLPVWVRIPGWLLRGPLCSQTKGLLSLRVAERLVSGMRSFCWRVSERKRCHSGLESEIMLVSWEFVCVYMSQPGLVSSVGKAHLNFPSFKLLIIKKNSYTVGYNLIKWIANHTDAILLMKLCKMFLKVLF